AAGHRAVELAALARLPDQDVGGPVQLLAGLAGGLAGLGVAGLDLRALALEDLEVGRVGAQRLLPRQQVVAGEAVLDVDHVAQRAPALEPFEQNDFHAWVSLTSRRR